jgi:hypothetical protein
MIRPVTCICFLLACGSGLYVYQSKHRAQVLDREIEKTVRAMDVLREQTRVLHAEWTLLNDPQRLQALAEQLLNLKTVTPGQFTSLADLDGRLPAVRVPEPVVQELIAVPVAEAPAQMIEPHRPLAVAAASPSTPAKPVATATVSPQPRAAVPEPPRIVEHKPSPPSPASAAPRQTVAEASSARSQSTGSRPAGPTDLPRPSPPRIIPVSMPGQPLSAPFAGSALGMARGAAAPPPMPFSASQWAGNGGGGG